MVVNKIVTFKWNQLDNQMLPSGNVHTTKTIYDANYVNKHYESLCKVSKENFEYICVTDDPKGISKNITTIPLWDKCRYLGGCYNRMYIFSKDMKYILGNKFLTIDIDTTFLKDFSFMFKPETTTVHKAKVFHPGISLIVAGELTDIWDSFMENIDYNISISRKEFNGTDQAWFNYYLKKNNKTVNYWTEEDGIYLMVNIRKKQLPKNCILVSWAGPRDPYQPEYRNLPWLKGVL